jgi:glycosyltransferase involved in cell wall biosynthesis
MTTVHWPDDTRIRERLIRSLTHDFAVSYAAKAPGPTDLSGIDYRPLRGGRIRRNLGAIRLALGPRWDLLVVHDPELIPCALLARALRRCPVVFDVHEDFPAAVYSRTWVPGPLRGGIGRMTGWLLRVAERYLTLTLAEPGYQRLFRGSHPTFPNFPDTSRYPEPRTAPGNEVVYLGDVTIDRGVDIAAEACAAVGAPLRLIGRVTPELGERLQSIEGADLIIDGLLPNETALEIVAGASVGLAPLRDLPNYRHSQPTKVLEYLAVGLPVVASDLPGTRTLVEGLDAVVLVPPGDAGALAEGIQAARTSDMVGRARAQAAEIRTSFRWPTEEVRSFYSSLV